MTDAFRLHPAVVHERLGDETIVVNLETGSYYSLQGTAADIWSALSGGYSRAAIVDQCLLGCSDVQADDAAGIAASVSRFLDALVAEGIVAPTDAPDFEHVLTPPAFGPFAEPVLQKYSDMEELLQIDPVHEVDENGWPSTARNRAA